MTYIICALAVYKIVQIADSITPKEAMPWVKVLFSTAVSYGISFLAPTDHKIIDGLVIATLAGAVHSILRLLTLLGDMSFKKSIK